MKKILFLFFLITSNTYSQNIDSLLIVARNSENDSIKIAMLNKVAFSYIFNDASKALLIIEEGKDFAEKKKSYFGLTEFINTHGIYMDIIGKSDSANFYFSKALKLSQLNNFPEIEVKCLNNLGMFNWNIGQHKEAIDYFFKSLKMYEARGDEKSSSVPLNNIGLIYQEMNLLEDALKYHRKSLAIREKYNLIKDQVASLNNIGICYKDLDRVDEAIEIYKKGIKLAKASNNYLDYYRIYDNLGNAYQIQGNYDDALKAYLESLKKDGVNRTNIQGDLSTYSNLMALYNKKNNPKKALLYSKKGFDILKKNPQLKSYALDLYLKTAESHYMMDAFEEARKHSDKFVKLKDSVFSENNANAVADLEVKYQTEKKEKEILSQRADLAEKELNINQKNTQLIGLIILAVVLSILGYLLYNQQKLKNRQLQKEGELKEALVKIETQNRLQEQRLRISRDLHDNIGAQLTFIISSIENLQYGYKITNKKLTNKLLYISDFTKDTIYELRDTIWAMNKNEISLEDLQTRISNFIDKADISSKSIRFAFNIDTSPSKGLVFSSVEGMSIYRIIQEATHNAIKYAEASLVTIDVKTLSERIQINITDNGKGFDENEIVYGNGLQNMKKRAEEINGRFTIDSKINEGTQVSLTLS